MRSTGATPVLLCLLALMGIGCSPSNELRQSTLESSALQLRTAERSGYPTQIVIEEQAIDSRVALTRREPVDSSTTYLVLTPTDAQIVWSEGLRDELPGAGRAIVAKWVAPYLESDDLDGALKAFVFGYLEFMYRSKLIEWEEAIVPFLPPGSAHPRPHPGAIVLSLLVSFLVVRASRYLD